VCDATLDRIALEQARDGGKRINSVMFRRLPCRRHQVLNATLANREAAGAAEDVLADRANCG